MARPILRLALAATLAAGEAAAGPVVFRVLDTARTGRPFHDRVRPLVRLQIVDGQPTGQDRILLLRRP